MSELQNFVNNALDRTVRLKGVNHFYRTTGSTIPSLSDGDSTVAFLKSIVDGNKCSEVTTEVTERGLAHTGCRYFEAQLGSEVEAYEGMALLNELPAKAIDQIRVRMGAHGPELVATGIERRRVANAHLIIGPGEPGQGMLVYTWYPGAVTPMVDLNMATVKLEG